MKFKTRKGSPDCKTLVYKDDFIIQTREDKKPGLFIDANTVFLTRNKALKLAWAIIDELDPDQTQH